MESVFESLAMEFFFHGSKSITETLEKFGLELKPEKTIADVKKAFTSGMSNGAGKFELEMQCCGIAFEDVLTIKNRGQKGHRNMVLLAWETISKTRKEVGRYKAK